MSATETITQSQTQGDRLILSGEREHIDDWHHDLIRDGYAVVKGAIPRERADGYAADMYQWLEDFNLGFDRKDLSTVHKDNLPIINEKGMCLGYGISHEDFVWKVRSEPGVVGAFETVYDEKDLIVSFDGINFGFPNRTDLPPNKPWPHQDQDPEKPGFRCLQGLVNLLPNGPDDGGLIVCKGAHLLSEDYHRAFANEERIPQWTNEWYGFKETGQKWLEEHGCEWIKVCAEPGDLIVWDSRAPHYNLSSKTAQPRFCIYTCYMPVKDASQEDLLRKKIAFDTRVGTTHWPNARHLGNNVTKRDGKDDPVARDRPVKEPQLDERGFKLTGIPYIRPTSPLQAETIDGPQGTPQFFSGLP